MQLNEAMDKVDKYEIINELINMYSKEIDSYQFDSIILDMAKRENKDIDYLCEKFEISRLSMHIILINFIVEELGFTETVNNLLEYNYKDKYDNYKEFSAFSAYNSILYGAICKNTYTFKRKTFPAALFSGVKFNSDAIIDVEIVPERGFSEAEFDDNKLIIKDGCKEIKRDAFLMTWCANLYLPSSLTRFEHSDLTTIKNIHYDGTKSKFIQLLKKSDWWKEEYFRNSAGCNVFCTNGVISHSDNIRAKNK